MSKSILMVVDVQRNLIGYNPYNKDKVINNIKDLISIARNNKIEVLYKIIIPEETNTTFDNEYLSANKLYEFYNYKIWKNRFAKVIPFKDVVNIFPEIL